VVAIAAPPQRCAEVETLEAIEPAWGSPATRMLSIELAGDIHRVDALRAAGRLDEAREHAEQLVARLGDDDDHLAVRAEVLLTLGQVQTALKDTNAAEKTLQRAVWAAEASGHIEMAALGWIDLVSVLGNQREDYARGMQAADRAAAAVHRLRDPVATLDLAANRAVTASVNGLYEEALEQYLEILARAPEVYEEDHPNVARVHFNVAASLSKMGRHDEAIDHARRGLAMFERRFAGRHPTMVDMFNTLGALELHRGNIEAGRAHLENGLALAAELLPAEHSNVASIVSNLAQIDMWEKRHEEAAAGYRRALAIYQAVHGPAHPDVALTLHNLAAAHDGLGEREQAVALYREALAMRLQVNGPEHPGTATTHHNLGLVLVGVGEIDEGIEHMERALAIREASKVDPYNRATTNFMLARAYEKRGDLTRARERALRSRDYLREIAPRHANILEVVETWLDQHPPSPKRSGD
jgi:eukaryotic-like serine/threonine-protein kinase